MGTRARTEHKMQLGDAVGTLSVLMTGLSAWFLARGMPKLDVHGLNDIGHGMKMSSVSSVFGVNHRQVQDACRKQTDTRLGLTLLICSIVGYLAARIVPQTRAIPLVCALVSLILFTITTAAALTHLSRGITTSFLMRRITELLEDRHEDHLRRGHPFNLTPDYHERITHDVGGLLDGLASRKRVAEFVTTLEADLQKEFGQERAATQEPGVSGVSA